ncbi:MAG: DNA polymerase III subunit delta [Rhabdaerophilum sp.]
MAVIRPAEVDRFIARAGQGPRIVLIFGPDEGAVRLKGRAFADAFLGPDFDPISKIEFEADALNSDPARLADEAYAISMFGDKRAILIRQANKLSKSIWQALFENPAPEAAIILMADELTKSSPLRVAAESNTQLAVIPCYLPSITEISATIEARFRAAGFSIGQAEKSALAELLGADQALSEGEIDKLILYCQGKTAIDIEDIEHIVADSSAGTGSEPLDLAFEGQLPVIERAAARSFRDGLSPAGLISMALSHVQLLRRLVAARSEGNMDVAVRQERLHFKREARIRRQAEHWSMPALARALETLAQAQNQGRMTASLEETIAIRALWAVSLAARRR